MSDTQTTLSFKYDHNGIRSKKTVNGVETKYTYVGSTLISQKTGDEVISFAYTNSRTPYGFTYNGASYFYLLNLQGDVIGIYDSTGTVVVKYAYDAWGKLISTTGSLASTIGVKNPIRYRGYYYDTETGLYYLQSRYYDPETCCFINADSLLIAGDYLQGTNMFAYCLNNPVMYADPTGYSSTEDLYKGIATLAMLAGLVNVGFVWFEPIMNDPSYENVYAITEDVANSLNWFYDMRGYEVSLENTRKLMGEITDMCTTISSVIGVSAIDIMRNYFTAEKIDVMFTLYGDKLDSEINSTRAQLLAAGISLVTTSILSPAGLSLAAILAVAGTFVEAGFLVALIDDFSMWESINNLRKHAV